MQNDDVPLIQGVADELVETEILDDVVHEIFDIDDELEHEVIDIILHQIVIEVIDDIDYSDMDDEVEVDEGLLDD